MVKDNNKKKIVQNSSKIKKKCLLRFNQKYSLQNKFLFSK